MTTAEHKLYDRIIEAERERMLADPPPPPAPVEPPTIHFSELPAAAAGGRGAAEWNFYRREVGRLLAGGHEGRWVLINFFATWCTPCVQEHDDLVRFEQAHRAGGDVAVLGVVYDDNAGAARKFQSERGGSWPLVDDPQGRIALDYGVAGVPESYLVSPDGVVVAKLVGGVAYAGLEDILAKVRAGAAVRP